MLSPFRINYSEERIHGQGTAKNNKAAVAYVQQKLAECSVRWPVPPQAGLLFGAMPKSK